MVLPGVTGCVGSVIAAGAIVTEDVPLRMVAIGIAAEVQDFLQIVG